MHSYERYILYRLALADQKRFSELRPKGSETNLFVYHLHKLIKEGLIKKLERGYALTAAGSRYVDKLSLRNFELRFQPKIVTLIVCRNAAGQYLFYTRRQQPFYGMVGFPYGKIHFGENVLQAAEREFREKTGLAARLKHRGEAYLTVSRDGELMTHMLCHVFSGDHPSGTLISENPVGLAAWNTLKNVDQKDFIPGFLEIFGLLAKSKKAFFKEIVISE